MNNLSRKDRKAEIGLWSLPEFWGQGIMTEVMPIISDYGFEKLELRRIEGFVKSENLNCKKALAKIYFQHEGTMKDFEIKNGKLISVDIYSKTK
jgi:ribosomal-protein-alanine N-acetyltransferase